MDLFGKECRKIITSLIFWLYVILITINWYINFRGVTKEEIMNAMKPLVTQGDLYLPLLRKPLPDDESFGMKNEEIPDKLMMGAADQLISDYQKNHYQYYPFSYVKFKTLSENKQNRVKEIIEEITGLTEEQFLHLPEYYFPQNNGVGIIHIYEKSTINSDGSFTINQPNIDEKERKDKTKHFISQVSYERFKRLMCEMESMIGHNSLYSMDSLMERFGLTEQTYEEALSQYDTVIQKDKVTGAFARLFCDYMGLSIGFYPIFVVVFMMMKDRRSKMQELIDSRKVSTVRLVLVRYLAFVIIMLFPVLLLSMESLIPLVSFGLKHQISIDLFGFVKYILWWILPTIMVVIAIGMCFTIMTDTPIAILIQLCWWFVDQGLTSLSGDYSLSNLMIRNNNLRGYNIIQSNLEILWTNRIVMLFLSLLLLFITAIFYHQKRRGRFDIEAWFSKCFRIIQNKFQTKYTK